MLLPRLLLLSLLPLMFLVSEYFCPFLHLTCSAIPWVFLSSSLGSFVDLFLLLSLSLSCSSILCHVWLFTLVPYCCCICITFVKSHFILDCGFYYIFSTYFLVSCLVGFFAVEAKIPTTTVHSSFLKRLCAVSAEFPVASAKFFMVPELESPFT